MMGLREFYSGLFQATFFLGLPTHAQAVRCTKSAKQAQDWAIETQRAQFYFLPAKSGNRSCAVLLHWGETMPTELRLVCLYQATLFYYSNAIKFFTHKILPFIISTPLDFCILYLYINLIEILLEQIINN